MGKILASAVRYKEHIAAFDSMTEQRFNDQNFIPALIYLIDTVSAEALPDLLQQFDLMGYKGARFVSTDQQKRDLIKNAIELKKYTGTAWAIREALKLIGVTAVRFIPVPDVFYYNGDYTYNGTQGYGQFGWARFVVKIDAATFPTITTDIIADIIALTMQYKPKSRTLVGVIGFGLLYDGTGLYDGTYNYDAEFYPNTLI